ncbi:MCT family MFS transporter [Sporobolomyces salmoneus]|uniref:MCT family MFS transporter n=1 Tax=Sporobolomyces salmoneus TaxID=183962 RepID=UPI00317E90E7
MSTERKADPPSPTVSRTSFESCETLNAIATLEEPHQSSRGSDPGESNDPESPSIHSKKTTASSKKEVGDEEDANHEEEKEVEQEEEQKEEAASVHSMSPSKRSPRSASPHSSIRSQESDGTFPNPLEEPNSPSNSHEPIRDKAASFARQSRRSSHSHSIDSSSDQKQPSSGHPTESTCREEDATSLKSNLEEVVVVSSLPTLPNDDQHYPPSSGKDQLRLVDPTIPDGGLRAWLNVLGGFLVLFASFGYTNSWGVYQAYYRQTIYRNHSDSEIAWVGSVQLCLFFLLALVAGPLFDKGKFRYLVAAGSAIQTTSIFLIPECTKFWQTMLVQGVMSGVGIGLCFLPALSIQSHWFLRRRAFAIGIVTCGSSIGGIVFPIMLNKLFANREVGFTEGVRASGYLVAASFVIANLIMSPHPARLIAQKPPLPPLRKIMTLTFCLMTGGAFLLNWGLWMPLFYLQIFAQSKGVSANLSFYTLAIYNAGSVFGRTIPNLAADYLGPQNIQSFCCVGAGLVLYCLYACNTAAGIVIFAAVYGALSGGFVSLVSPAIISISDDISEIGLRQGVAFLIVAGGAVGGNPICGKLVGLGGGTDPFVSPIAFAATACLLGGIVTTAARFVRAKEKGTWRV